MLIDSSDLAKAFIIGYILFGLVIPVLPAMLTAWACAHIMTLLANQRRYQNDCDKLVVAPFVSGASACLLTIPRLQWRRTKSAGFLRLLKFGADSPTVRQTWLL